MTKNSQTQKNTLKFFSHRFSCRKIGAMEEKSYLHDIKSISIAVPPEKSKNFKTWPQTWSIPKMGQNLAKKSIFFSELSSIAPVEISTDYASIHSIHIVFFKIHQETSQEQA